jgi:hypothetical protein
MEALPQDLADFLVTKNFDPEYFDAQGQPSEAGDAKTMKFDYVSGTGKNYGTAVCVIADDELSLFYGDNLGRGMESEDKDEWYSFLEELSNKAASHSATWSPRDINQLKHTLAGIAAIKEGLFEGYYGNRRVSYMGEQTQARLVINHNRVLGENDKRFRYVESLFIETADQERFRLPFKSLAGGRAMLEHVRSGGRPYDVRGNHITEVVSEMAVLSRFNRAQHHRVYEGVTQELVESAQQYYRNLQETIKHLGSPRGYQAYFESWAPDHIGEAESLVENLRNLFVEQTLDARIEAALPTLAKIQQQGNNMKEAQIFENWINNLSEGTWALPETPEQMEKLNQLMSGELIVGPDAINATEQLYDLVGDDELFDILNDLADRSEGRANCWDDSDVQRRLAELGIQTPQSTQAEPADVDQDTAPEVKEGLAQDEAEEEYGGWRAELVNQINYNTFEVEVTNARSKESANFIIRPVDMVSYGPTLSVETFDVHDLQTGQTQSWTNDDPAPEGPIAYAISALFYDEKPLQKALWNIVDTHNKKGQDKLPGLDQRRSIGQEVGIDDYVDAGEKTQAAMAKMKKGMAEGFDPVAQDYSDWSQALHPHGDGATAFDIVARYSNGDANTIRNILTYVRQNRHMLGREAGDRTGRTIKDAITDIRKAYPQLYQAAQQPQGMAEGDNMSTFVEDRELAEMLKYAGVPIKEGVLTDSTGSTLDHIQNTFKRDVKDFAQTGNMSDALYDVLYDYYFDDMPYGTKKARTGDPHEWISDRFAEDLGINENLISPMIMPVSEGSCNMTMEGSYCPEHGLATCEGMYEDGKTASQRTDGTAQQQTAPSGLKYRPDTTPTKSVADRPFGLPPKLNPRGMSQAQIDDRMTSVGFIPGTRDHAAAGKAYRAAVPNIKRPVSKPLPRSDIQGTDLGPADTGVDEDGGAVGMPYSMGEGTDDPINYNAAMTGAYYEGKETRSQEGDALLARIKSLALLR